jgi:hypothetical protein
VRCIVDSTTGSASTSTDQWAEITVAFTATATTHSVTIQHSGTPAAGERTWIDYVQIIGAGEDLTSSRRVLARSQISISYGRDTARSLSQLGPGRAALTLNNSSGDYSPELATSPLAGLLGPGRQMHVVATFAGRAYTLYRGFVDDYTLDPGAKDQSVRLTALDGLSRLKEVQVSTALHPAVRTGEAIGHILDAIGWTAGRDLDPGATTLRWWWEEGSDAFSAVQRAVTAEGPTAIVHIGADGAFIFRDRHHRLVRAASTTAQATLRGGGTEPTFSVMDYDAGWRSVVNSVKIEIDESDPAAEYVAVWSDDTAITLSPGESRSFQLAFENPVHAAIPPVWGEDVINTTGDAVTSTLSRTSGQSLTLTVSTSPSASPTVITNIQLRALPLTSARRLTITAEDSASIARYGRRDYQVDAPRINRHDAAAIIDLILGQRAERRPAVTVTLKGGNDARVAEQVTRDLSDRIRVIGGVPGLDADFFVEHIGHSVDHAGILLETKFGAEKAATISANLFRFDVAGVGFNDGVFAPSGIDDPGTIFRFDTAGRGFNDGLLAT